MPYLQSYQFRGDPGLFGSLFSGIKGAVGGLISGGPLGAIAGGIRGITGGGQVGRGRALPMAVQGPRRPFINPPFGGAPGVGLSIGERPGAVPRGYRYNKSGYFTKDGQYHAPGTKLVRVRTRNPANTRALRRALSRVESFGGIVKRARKTTRRLKTL